MDGVKTIDIYIDSSLVSVLWGVIRKLSTILEQSNQLHYHLRAS